MADITAILASLDVDLDPTAQKRGDLQRLIRAWTNERLSPALLPYPTAILARVTSQIRTKIEQLEDSSFALSELVQSQAAGYSGNGVTGGSTGGLAGIIQETALNRVRFLVRSLLRTRLSKISVQTPHLYALAANDPFRLEQLLSKEEETFLRARWGLVSRSLQDSCLDGLPAQFRGLDDNSGSGPDMRGGGLDEKSELQCVIVRVLKTDDAASALGGPNQGLQSDSHDSMVVHGVDQDEVIRLRVGDCWVIRWGDVRRRVENDSMELV